MSCKYNNSMYTITPPEDEVEFDYLEQILLSEDYETQEEIDHRLADEYKQFQIYELSDEQMLEFARAGELAYLRELKNFLNTPGMKKEVKYKVLEAQL